MLLCETCAIAADGSPVVFVAWPCVRPPSGGCEFETVIAGGSSPFDAATVNPPPEPPARELLHFAADRLYQIAGELAALTETRPVPPHKALRYASRVEGMSITITRLARELAGGAS